MRRSIAKTLLVGAACSLMVACNSVDQNTLPKEANTFLSEHFNDVPIAQILDTITQLGYTAILENGTIIYFDEFGDWEEINFKKNGTPASILQTLPKGMSTYITENYDESNIKKITKKHFGRNNFVYRVAFNKPNNIELRFAKDGELISNDPEDKRLPSIAKNIIEQFDNANIESVIVDVDGDIEVDLEDKTELEFDRKGNWISMKSKKKALPESILNQLPKAMNKYLSQQYPDQFIRKIEKKSYGYRIWLNKPNDIELCFTKSGNLISEGNEE